MRKSFTLFFFLSVFFAFGTRAFGQLLLTEDFNYPATSLLTANGWTANSGGGTNALTVTGPGLTYAGSPSSGIGNAVSMTTSGEDDAKGFVATGTGTVYSSLLVNVSAAQTTGDYFFGLQTGTSVFPLRVFIKATTGGFVFGVAKQGATPTYETTVRTFGTTYLLVNSYTYNTGTTTDDIASLWINPALGSTESLPALTNGAGTADATSGLNGVFLRQGTAANASTQIVDAIRVGTTWESVTPSAVDAPTITSLSPASANAGSPGITLTVNGTNFSNGSVVTWNGSSRTTTFVSATQLTAVIPASDLTTAGTALVGVSSGSVASNTQTFTINAVTGPAFSLTSALPDFGNVCINTTAGPASFTLDGSNLDGSNGSTISLAALPGFGYSLSASGPFTSTLSFTYTGTGFTGKVIYVQFTPTAVQPYNGNINVSGGGISSYPVAATGSGVNAGPAVSTGGSTPSGASATLNATLTSAGCGAAVTAYGFEYSVNSGFADGTGTPVSSSNLSGGNFSAVITGLQANRRYYYKAFVTTSGGTTYGLQQAFNAPPVPVLMSAQPSFTYTETFADIANWGNFFVGGIGAEHFSQASGSTGAIPSPTNVTTTTVFSTGPSGGVQRGTDQVTPLTPTQSIVLLATGTTDNTSSAAFDLFLDFTGVNAGMLSFDYQTLNNGGATDNRNGSLRVYASTDGVSYSEVTNVLNFTNNLLLSGSKTNIPLPASFNNSPTARLRFYYYNGTGGSTGARPKISLDNIVVTALATSPCTTPTAPATALTFGTITDVSIAGNFTAASPASDTYLIVASTNSSLTGNPVDGQAYNVGDNIGDGTVVAKGSGTSFTATGLSASTTYYFFVFPVNAICTGGPLYYTTTVLSGQATTAAGLPPCAAPASQPTALTFGATTTNSVAGSFTATAADEYLVVRSTTATLSAMPVNGQAYVPGDALGGGVVVQRSNATSFAATGLSPNTTYYFFVFSANTQACVNGPAYNTAAPLTGTAATQPLPPCAVPLAQPYNLMLNAANTAIAGNFAPAPGTDAYLVVRSTSSTLSALPGDNTAYAIGDNVGGGTVIGNSSGNTFMSTDLTPGTTYYYFIFSVNSNCTGGARYLTALPLTGSKATLNTTANSYYFGTLHSHSDYSDGNQDHPGYTPTDDYNYAMTAQCMDYLGISEHNHFSSPDNPGNKLSTYHAGITEANTFTAAHPSFLALYGMEWGVISGGGHVVVYGNGMDNLFGWESGSGQWGPSNNYDVYVAKNDYTGPAGLFRTVNGYAAQNTFATLAHPNLTDYNNLANVPYNAAADSAITATAVESGPASSTNTTYSDPGSSMGYLWYYQTLLSKGYHLGPVVDHDNHKTTFGKTTYSRTAIVAPSLTKADIIAAMHDMHFYATQDCDTKVDFMVNARMMGSVFTDRYAPVISVRLTDATTSTLGAFIRLFYGQPGSGLMPVQIDSAIGNTYNYTDNNLANGTTGYYYLDITNGTSRIVTAPVWYNRNDNNGIILPVRLASFTATKEASSVKLAWTTGQEHNTKEFVVERSLDGIKYEALTTVAAKGTSAVPVAYAAVDAHPAQGNNYYRLRTVDADGKAELSNVVKLNFAKGFTVSLSPNPATGYVLVGLSGAARPVIMQLLNAAGKTIKTATLTNGVNRIALDGLAKGLYVARFTGLNDNYTEKLLIQ